MYPKLMEIKLNRFVAFLPRRCSLRSGQADITSLLTSTAIIQSDHQTMNLTNYTTDNTNQGGLPFLSRSLRNKNTSLTWSITFTYVHRDILYHTIAALLRRDGGGKARSDYNITRKARDMASRCLGDRKEALSKAATCQQVIYGRASSVRIARTQHLPLSPYSHNALE